MSLHEIAAAVVSSSFAVVAFSSLSPEPLPPAASPPQAASTSIWSGKRQSGGEVFRQDGPYALQLVTYARPVPASSAAEAKAPATALFALAYEFAPALQRDNHHRL